MSDGTGLRGEFLLDPNVTFLNHGSFGACPRAVFERYQQWQLQLERQPVLFLARRLEGLLAEARAGLGAYVGAPTRTTSSSSRSRPRGSTSPRGRRDCGQATKCCRPTSNTAPLTWPGSTCAATSPRATCGRRSACPSRAPRRSSRRCGTASIRARVLFLSHHTSTTALTLPVGELCRRAREAGIRMVIDGAHAPGHLPLNLRALDPDYYAGNCHEW